MKEKEKNDYLALFGVSLRQFRLNVGLSQEELAEKADIDRSYLGAVERGEHNLALINIIKVAKALDICPHQLLEVYKTQKVQK